MIFCRITRSLSIFNVENFRVVGVLRFMQAIYSIYPLWPVCSIQKLRYIRSEIKVSVWSHRHHSSSSFFFTKKFIKHNNLHLAWYWMFKYFSSQWFLLWGICYWQKWGKSEKIGRVWQIVSSTCEIKFFKKNINVTKIFHF